MAHAYVQLHKLMSIYLSLIGKWAERTNEDMHLHLGQAEWQHHHQMLEMLYMPSEQRPKKEKEKKTQNHNLYMYYFHLYVIVLGTKRESNRGFEYSCKTQFVWIYIYLIWSDAIEHLYLAHYQCLCVVWQMEEETECLVGSEHKICMLMRQFSHMHRLRPIGSYLMRCANMNSSGRLEILKKNCFEFNHAAWSILDSIKMPTTNMSYTCTIALFALMSIRLSAIIKIAHSHWKPCLFQIDFNWKIENPSNERCVANAAESAISNTDWIWSNEAIEHCM